MPKALLEFLKSNAKFAYGGGLLFGGIGAAATGLDFNKNLKQGDTAFKALLKTVKDFLLIRVALVGTFTAAGAAIRSLVKDTGSLDAALKRLSEIQRIQRVFTPLVGGAKEARRHVADLLNFAANTPFKFESVAEADKNLRGFTRGAFAGTGALKTIGDAAAASGNGIAEAAQAVGNFYETLHNGEPIGRAADELRQMGLITDLAATHLDRLSQSGASSVEMTSNLTRALEESRGGMSSFAKDLESVSTAHEKAIESAKAGFGKAFTAPDIQNTKNYTAAIVAMTPALEQSGKFLAGWFNTFATVGSKIAKFTAETGFLGGAIKVLSAVLVGGAAGLTIFGLAAIPIVGPFLALTAALTFGAVGIYRFGRASKDAARELKELNKAHHEAQANIDAHAASIQDLTDLQEQYGREVQHIIDLQNELNDAQKKGDAGKIKEITRAIGEARAHMANLPAPQQLASRERGAVIGERLEERRMRERARVEEAIEAQPGAAAQINRQRAEQLEQRAETARQGLQTRQRIAEAQGETLQKRADLQLEVAGLEKKKESGKITREENQRLKQAKVEQATIEGTILTQQEEQGKGASVGLEAQAQRLEHAQRANALEAKAAEISDKKQQKDLRAQAVMERKAAGGAVAGADTGRRIQDIRAQAQELAGYETTIPEIAGEARSRRQRVIAQTREQAVTGIGMVAETGAAQALLTGQTRERERFQDIGAFVQSFEQFRQIYGDDQARQMALQKRQNDLTEQLPADIKPVADSLTRIGGGGGVAGPTGDRAQRVRERMVQLQADSLNVLNQIATNTAQAGTVEAGGGAASAAAELPPGAPGTPEATTSTPATAPETEWQTGAAHLPTPGIPIPSALPAPTTTFQQLTNIPPNEEMQPEFTMPPRTVGSIGAPLPRVEPIPGTVGTVAHPLPQSQAVIEILKQIHNSNKQSNEHLGIISESAKDSGKAF